MRGAIGQSLIKTGRAVLPVILDDRDIPVHPIIAALLAAMGDNIGCGASDQDLKLAPWIALLVEAVGLVAGHHFGGVFAGKCDSLVRDVRAEVAIEVWNA